MTERIGVRRSKSPSLFQRRHIFHGGVAPKVWVVLDPDSPEASEINQPTAIEYEEGDTMDDLKTRIFEKFKETNWSLLHDNFDTCIGIWCDCHSETDATRNTLETTGKTPVTLHHPVPTSASVPDADLSNNSINHGPLVVGQRSRTASPWQHGAVTPIISSPKALHTRLPASAGQQTYVSTPLSNVRKQFERPTPSPTYTARSRRASRVLPCSRGGFQKGPHQMIFEPDELVLNVCNSLFGGLAAQKAANALVVFSSRKDWDLPEGLDDENHRRQDIQVTEEDTEEQVLEEPPQEDYKLIVNEEQLRGLDGAVDEESGDSRKQAIILLPKGFEGDVNLPSSLTSSPKSDVSKGLNFQDGSLETALPLVEEEVGLVPSLDPLIQREVSPLSQVPGHDKLAHVTKEKIVPRINVLVVEDNVINQAILGSFLRKHKISYKIAKNGREAVDIWRDGGMHLVLMDLQLPVMSGLDAAKEIRHLEKVSGVEKQKTKERQFYLKDKGDDSSSSSDSEISDKRETTTIGDGDQDSDVTTTATDTEVLNHHLFKTPVIIVALTASNSKADRTEALLAGCNDYLTKPVNLDWLSNKITEWGCMQALIDFDSWKQGQRHNTG
ncbi:LAMI_0H09450g1_1 [Lachancea mirantina]|uniref:LAMI_0H09450g1_1 n=1 Tax=Lachancea mirantina TaxID=1230905 RepID=A0A1G4KG99_9SACH|nr:LAMI_0H09450g1_1 [Lachancea mirantina]